MVNRIFLAQTALDALMDHDSVDIDGQELTLDGHEKLDFVCAIHFTAEVSGTEDSHQLVGKVLSIPEAEDKGAEIHGDAAIVDPNAYEVREGFVASASDEGRAHAIAIRLDELLREVHT